MDVLNFFKDKIIYHITDGDLDGIGSLIVSKIFVEPVCKKIDYYSTFDRDLPVFDLKKAEEADIIIFTDLAPFSLSFYNQINKDLNKVYIFDHHATTRSILSELPNYFFDIERCGSKIFFDFLSQDVKVKKSLIEFIDLIQTYDLFQTDSPIWRQAKGLNNLLFALVDWNLKNEGVSFHLASEKFINSQINKLINRDTFFFTPLEKELIFKAENKEKQYFKQAKVSLKIRQDNSGNNYGVFSCASKISLVSHLLLNDLNGKVDYLVGFSTWDKNNTKISLRSGKNGIDVSTIASLWGGGGHKNSAGIDFKEKEKLNDFLEGKFHLI